MRLLPTHEDGEDAVQDAMLLGYRKLHQFKGEAQFSTWMHSILFNAARNLLRKRKARLKTCSMESETEDENTPQSRFSIADHRANPEEEFRRAETFRLAHELVEALPPNYRAVVALCDLEGLAMKAVAEKLGRPVGTIKCQLHRAHQLISNQVRHQFAIHRSRPPSPVSDATTRGSVLESIRIPRAKSRLKLQPNPIPEPIWGFSAYRLLRGGGNWQQIRRDSLAAAGHRCSVCGSTWGPLRCHCKWVFSDNDATARIAGFVILCSSCDAASHLIGAVQCGRADLAVRQLSHVNQISLAEAQHVLQEAMKVWNERNKKKWHLTVSASLLDRYPRLNVLNSANECRQGLLPTKFPSVRLRTQLSRDSIGILLAGEG
jgi:RNA polymerase sigma-70 factor, ECF subfamily